MDVREDTVCGLLEMYLREWKREEVGEEGARERIDVSPLMTSRDSSLPVFYVC